MAMYKCPKNTGLQIVPWASATYEEIKNITDAYYAGDISLAEIQEVWSIGDQKDLVLAAMPATYVGETHAVQIVQLTILNWGGKTLASDHQTECLAVVGLIRSLKNTNGSTITAEPGYMNSSSKNTGGWRDCKRRSWCNEVFRDAMGTLPQQIFKEFDNVALAGNSSTIYTMTDYFSLPSVKEINATPQGSPYSREGDTFEYWSDFINHIVQGQVFSRSATKDNTTSFQEIYSGSGKNFPSAYAKYASNTSGIIPYGCI